MKTKTYYKYLHWVGLLLILAAFAACKASDLSLPYFWDELGVYAPGSLYMKDTHTIGLLPNCLPPDYSRGHPLLCFFAYATVFILFGDSVLIGHLFSLAIAMAVLVVFYLFCKRLFGTAIGMAATILLAVQPVFYAMSGIIMPEMLLTLLVIAAVWAVVQRHWTIYWIAAALALLTKEAAVAVPLAVAAYLFWEGLLEKELFRKHKWIQISIALSPLVVFIVFLVIQKQQNGWYFFPLHTQYIRHNPLVILRRAFTISTDTLFLQGRWLVGRCAILGAGLGVILYKKDSLPHRAILLMSSFFVVSQLFAGTNYFLPRYNLIVIPFIVLVGVYAVCYLGKLLSPTWRWPIVALFGVSAMVLAYRNLDPKSWTDCHTMAYKHQVMASKDCINWVERQPWAQDTIAANFPIFQALSDTRNGYITGKPIPFSINGEQHTAYGILYQVDGVLPVIKGKTYHEIRRFTDAYAKCSVVKFE